MTSQTNERALEEAIEKALTGTSLEELKVKGITNVLSEEAETYGNKTGYHIGTPQEFNKEYAIDAIFVLAGGLKNHNTLNDWVIDRLDLAYDIYSKTNVKIICMGGGTYHKPSIINEYGYTVHESTICADYLVELGVNPKDIYREWSSYDTIANGYFAFMNYIYPLKLKNILVITSEFHMERVKIIFNWINSISLNINVISL